ncbi:hypothetical protein [Halorhodospira sp. 9622]|uniref:hypothetical protein n=1 Tax=Halorhodospira sp. 9622 TaxID=2899136 RepID=UPI001EE79742|nr:hypothetical protein [Halorhodospira sp. 9622]MCG5537440.1 hypothetical protein [Halorhodospira sp. 9622]
MRNFDWTKGALALTAGSVLAIGSGQVLAQSGDSDEMSVDADMAEAISVDVENDHSFGTVFPGQQVTHDGVLATVEGEDDAEFTADIEGELTENADAATLGTNLDTGNGDLDGGSADIEGSIELQAENDVDGETVEGNVTISADYMW